MATITIPKEFAKYDKLTAISEERYEELLRARVSTGKEENKRRVQTEGERVLAIARSLPVVRRLKRHKKFYEELDKSIAESIEEYKRGEGYGPFETAEEGIKFLDSYLNTSAKKIFAENPKRHAAVLSETVSPTTEELSHGNPEKVQKTVSVPDAGYSTSFRSCEKI